jgi:polysaccharide deacetylase 2 family uncharacterized protein YibQ
MDYKRIAVLSLIILLALFACKGKADGDNESDQYTPKEEYSEEPEDTTLEEPAPNTDQSPLKAYKYTWSEDDDMPPVVIIIDDFGNSAGKLLEEFADLPDEVVFAVLPDLPHTETAAKLAHRKGHEVIIHVPMQAEGNSVSPGKKFIKAGMPESDIKEIMADFIAQMPMAIAANNHMGSAATANRETMNSVLHELKQNGLFFIDSATTSKSAVFTAASELGVFSTRRDIFLDVPDVTDATIISKIESLGKYKGRKEPVIIISHCHNNDKLKAMKKFIAQIEDMGIKIKSLKKAFPEANV